ncbi:actin nucleation-promoting factor WASL-like [Euwallacea similis]|uniref:actin nucleation-promoting factor WASL-like n=1 Tax=Euwallacea similis TaxID=1736056 RepID=UPI003450A71F
MRMPPPSMENQSSNLLSTDENLQVFRLLGNRCQTIATTVAQLFVTAPPNHSQWMKRGTGVLCFVKDNIRKNYFFRMFNLKHNQMVWEHEMYNNMEYIEAAPFFHTFEGEECIVAFNFADPQEAAKYKSMVEAKVIVKRKREEKKARYVSQTGNTQISPNMILPPKNLDFNAKQEFRKEKRKRNITKADISIPMGFVHISHVGWNADTGFDVSIDDDQLKSLFQKAGVSEKQLQDKETREFIYDFINKNRDLVSAPNPPVVPPRGPPRPVSANPRPAPPPPPVPQNPALKKPRPPSPPKPLSGPSAPPPPPPPPMITGVPPPPPPITLMSNGANNFAMPDVNATLMQSIREGTTLKPVEDSRGDRGFVDEARGDLLSEIRKGIQLKPVDEREVKPVQNPSPTGSGGNDLAKALKQALLERSKVIHSEDDDDDTSSTSNDDEWDD